ncbi:hypothetical protein J6590_106823, partial [Homalodisca vitripennis]
DVYIDRSRSDQLGTSAWTRMRSDPQRTHGFTRENGGLQATCVLLLPQTQHQLCIINF